MCSCLPILSAVKQTTLAVMLARVHIFIPPSLLRYKFFTGYETEIRRSYLRRAACFQIPRIRAVRPLDTSADSEVYVQASRSARVHVRKVLDRFNPSSRTFWTFKEKRVLSEEQARSAPSAVAQVNSDGLLGRVKVHFHAGEERQQTETAGTKTRPSVSS